MSVVTVKRRDIFLREEVESIYDSSMGGDQRIFRSLVTWRAQLLGRLSDGVHVDMERVGETSKQAFESLEAALNENGWEIR